MTDRGPSLYDVSPFLDACNEAVKTAKRNGFRAGAEAMREACAARIEEGGSAWSPVARDIRSIPIPESDNG